MTSRAPKHIDFGDWAPDAPKLGASQVQRNVIPGEGALRPFPEFDALADDAQSPAIAGAWSEGFTAFAGDGAIDVIAATSTNFYRWNGDDFASINSGFTDPDWRFAQWGDEIVATNPTHGLHVAEIGGVFTADATPPAARHIARLGYRIMLGGLAAFPNAVQWCGFNDRTNWTIGDRAAGSDINYMPREYGAVTGIKGGARPLVFQERAIHLVRPDSGFVYAFDPVEEELGCAASRSIQTYGAATFFVSQEGPAVIDGQQARLLGERRFRRWFQDAAEGVTQSSITSAIDKRNKFVLWAWRTDAGLQQGMIYNWAEDRAAEWRPGASYPFLFNLPASITDTNVLTATAIGSYSGDALQTRVSGIQDRPRLAENTLIPGSINASDRLGRFNGAAMEAVIETPEWMHEPANAKALSPRSRSSSALVVGDAPPASVFGTLSIRQDGPGDSIETAGEVQGDARGFIALNGSGRSHKLSIRIPAGAAWEHAVGVQVARSDEAER